VAVYRPAICLDAGVFSVSLFSRPSHGCYCFGDYYDARYERMGIRPWFYYNSPRVGFDPLFGYYRWYHVDRMGERQWGEHLVGWHDYYRGHPDMRPPRTWAAQEVLLSSRAGQMRPDFAQLRLVGDVHVVARLPGVSIRLGVVSPAEREHLQIAARESVRFEAERRQVERQSVGGAGFHGPERVSISAMPSFKAAGPSGSSFGRPVGPGAPGGPGRATVPGRGNPQPGKSNSRERDREKKPQASSTPEVRPAIVNRPEPSRIVERPRPSNSAAASAVVVKSQPQVRTVMKPETGPAVAPPTRPQAAANNNAANRPEKRGEERRVEQKRVDDKRGANRDKDKE
jgi:hypothetical protein